MEVFTLNPWLKNVPQAGFNYKNAISKDAFRKKSFLKRKRACKKAFNLAARIAVRGNEISDGDIDEEFLKPHVLAKRNAAKDASARD
jgi:hypothetical protein